MIARSASSASATTTPASSCCPRTPPSRATTRSPLLGCDDPVIELNDHARTAATRSPCAGWRARSRIATDVDYVDPAQPRRRAGRRRRRLAGHARRRRAAPRFVARRVNGVDPKAASPWWMQRRLLARRDAADLADRRRHQLRDARAGPAAARLRRGAAVRRRSWCGGRGRARRSTTLDDVERRARPRRPADHRRLRPDRARRRDGRRVDRDPARHRADRRRSSRRPTSTRRRSPAAPGGTSCPARRRAGSSARSTRSCRRSRPSGSPRCSSSTAAGRSPAGRTDVGAAPAAAPVRMALDLPDRVAGVAYPPGATVRRLGQVGCAVELGAGADGRGQVVATPPSWRPDLVAARRPRRGGAAAGGLRGDPVGAADRARRTGPHTRPAPAPHGVGGAGRGGLRRGAAVPVRRAGTRGTRSGWPPTTRAATRCPSATRSTPTAPSCAPRCCRACSTRSCATGHAGAGDLALFTVGPGRAAAPRAARAARAGRRPASVRRRDRADRRRAARSAAARRRGAGR